MHYYSHTYTDIVIQTQIQIQSQRYGYRHRDIDTAIDIVTVTDIKRYKDCYCYWYCYGDTHIDWLIAYCIPIDIVHHSSLFYLTCPMVISVILLTWHRDLYCIDRDTVPDICIATVLLFSTIIPSYFDSYWIIPWLLLYCFDTLLSESYSNGLCFHPSSSVLLYGLPLDASSRGYRRAGLDDPVFFFYGIFYFILSCYNALCTLIHIFYSCDYMCYPALGYYYCSLLLMTVFLRRSVFVKGNFSPYECVDGRLHVHLGMGHLIFILPHGGPGSSTG